MQAGSHIGHFELMEVIGRGGMGEVWRARDTRLRRDVALKTLPPHLTGDGGRMERLTREARMLATLNHPNIATILGFEEQAGQSWLVLEFVDGSTLEDSLASGRMPLRDALDIALQVAEALEAAHARGIIHCDLKPSNIQRTAEGRVKVLDFGIARVLQPSLQTTHTTLTALPAAPAEVAGTVAYMSPEQLRGDQVGATSDIWSFGVLLYRLLTGALPFRGHTVADVAAQVLQSPPDLSLLDSHVPTALIRVIARCLDKEPRRRIQHAGDLRIMIDEALLSASSSASPGLAPRWSVIAACGLAALAALGTMLWWMRSRDSYAALRESVRAELLFDRGVSADFPFGYRRVAISPDGSMIAVATIDGLSLRSLGATQPVAVKVDCVNPFFSPDGAWVGCFSERLGLVKIPVAGGSPLPLASITERTAGAVWTRDGSILVATSEGLFRLDDGGSQPELLLRPDAARGERQYAWPELLPGDRSLLLTVLPRDPAAPRRIVLLDLDSRRITPVLEGGVSPRYVAGGILLYGYGSQLLAVPFDARSRRIHGEPRPVPDVQIDIAGDNGAASYAVSNNGTLVTMRPRPTDSTQRALYWRDAHGVETPLDLPPGSYAYWRVSPDGSRIALDVRGSDSRDVWIFDLARSSLSRVTTDSAEDNLPAWSRDGRRVYFSSNRGGDFDIYSQSADASGAVRKEVTAPGPQMLLGLSPDGRQILTVEEFRRLTAFDAGTGARHPLLHDDAVYWVGSISPDGHWLAYESNESGDRVEIFLRPFPNVDERREKISLAGGRYPVWGPAGSHALYFVRPDGVMMRAELRLGPTLQLGPVTQLFAWAPWSPMLNRISGTPYDVSPKDGRFLLSRPLASAEPGYIQAQLIFNWFPELRRLLRE